MHFAYPQLGPASVVTVAIVLFAGLGLLRKRRRLRQLAAQPSLAELLHVRRSIQVLKSALIAGAAALLAVTMLGPQWGHAVEEQEPIQGRDLLILLDVSRSMLARDVAPSRLERAKADIRDLVATLKKNGGYRVGLITFADRAALICPLTSDYRAFEDELRRASLQTLRLRNVSAARDGTQIGLALDRAGRAIHKETANCTDVLLISDGGDMDQDTIAAADQLAVAGVPVHTLGLGDPVHGATIPIESGPGRAETVLTYQGQPVMVTLEEPVLREVAQRTKGEYLAVGTGYLELDRWYDQLVAGKQLRELTGSGSHEVWTHRFQWFLAPALVLLLVEMLLGDGRRKMHRP